MKFAVVAVVLALALATEASVVAWGPALSYTAVHGPVAPVAVAAPGISTAWGHGGAWGHGAWGPATAWGPAAWAPGHWAGPAAVPAHAAVVPAVVPAGHEGSYVAKTRGAVHVAPLSGHANSAASINVLPAPGTV